MLNYLKKAKTFMGKGRTLAPSTTLCLPDYCIYAHACLLHRGRPCRVEARRCLRFRPEGMRPSPALSRVALEALFQIRRSRRG